MFQYQSLIAMTAGSIPRSGEIGTNYIIKGHDARLSAMYSQTDYKGDGEGAYDGYLVGLQLQVLTQPEFNAKRLPTRDRRKPFFAFELAFLAPIGVPQAASNSNLAAICTNGQRLAQHLRA